MYFFSEIAIAFCKLGLPLVALATAILIYFAPFKKLKKGAAIVIFLFFAAAMVLGMFVHRWLYDLLGYSRTYVYDMIAIMVTSCALFLWSMRAREKKIRAEMKNLSNDTASEPEGEAPEETEDVQPEPETISEADVEEEPEEPIKNDGEYDAEEDDVLDEDEKAMIDSAAERFSEDFNQVEEETEEEDDTPTKSYEISEINESVKSAEEEEWERLRALKSDLSKRLHERDVEDKTRGKRDMSMYARK